MRIKLKGGEEITLKWHPMNCVGYRAESIEIDRDDIRAMREYAMGNPHEFAVAMMQLEARFGIETPIPIVSAADVPKIYTCAVCGSDDVNRYVRCQHAGCPDGRDR